MKRNFVCILTSLIISGLLGIGSISIADSDMWAKKADIPTKRYGFGAATVKGKIYTFGGWGEEGGPLAIVEEYEPLTDKWTRKADMPTARHFIEPSVVAMNGKIYVIGGALHFVNWPNAVDNLPTTEEYDPTTNTWRKRADMPTPRSGAMAVAVDGKIYAIGGYGPGGFPPVVEEYEPAVDRWMKKANAPMSFRHTFGVAVNGKVYVLGDDVALSALWEYEPKSDVWKRKRDIPSPRCRLSAAVSGGKIYAMGGNGPLTIVEEYDPATDTWTKRTDMLTPRGSFASAVVNGKVYAIGGCMGIPWENPRPIVTVEEYTPEGWESFSISLEGKLATTWGKMKQGR